MANPCEAPKCGRSRTGRGLLERIYEAGADGRSAKRRRQKKEPRKDTEGTRKKTETASAFFRIPSVSFRGLALLLVHLVHPAAARGRLLLLLGRVRDQRVRGEEQGRDARRV